MQCNYQHFDKDYGSSEDKGRKNFLLTDSYLISAILKCHNETIEVSDQVCKL